MIGAVRGFTTDTTGAGALTLTGAGAGTEGAAGAGTTGAGGAGTGAGTESEEETEAGEGDERVRSVSVFASDFIAVWCAV